MRGGEGHSGERVRVGEEKIRWRRETRGVANEKRVEKCVACHVLMPLGILSCHTAYSLMPHGILSHVLMAHGILSCVWDGMF